MSTEPNAPSDGKTEMQMWAVLELFGHQKIAGLLRQEVLAGFSYLRVDVPAVKGIAAFTRFFNPSAVYSINPVVEVIARAAAEYMRSEPIKSYELPALPAGKLAADDESEEERRPTW